MVTVSVFLLLLLLSPLLPAQDPPNIIIIFTDDQGYADLGVQGEVSDIATPHIDRLARTGVLVTQGYVTAPQCIPSRAGLLTGRYQQKFGTDHNGTVPLPLEEVTIAERMKEAGYVTGMTGKWHLDPNHQQEIWIRENLPERDPATPARPGDIPFAKKAPYMSSARGFDYVFQGYSNRFWANYTLDGTRREAQWTPQEGYRLDVQTEAALTFIRMNQEAPFFFYLSYFAPHVPLEATQQYLDRFPEDMPTRRRYCLAMLSAIDDGVGRITRTLEELNLAENTVIFFLSDNGAPLKITKEDIPISFRGGAWDGSLNDPLTGEKGMLSEGGIRVPFVVNWPARLPAGMVYSEPVISLDIAASSLALAGAPIPSELDGVNIIPYLTGEEQSGPAPTRPLYWRFWNQLAVREGDYKLLRVGKHELLFNLREDPREQYNRREEEPARAEALRKSLADWEQQLRYPDLADSSLNAQEEGWYRHYFDLGQP